MTRRTTYIIVSLSLMLLVPLITGAETTSADTTSQMTVPVDFGAILLLLAGGVLVVKKLTGKEHG